MAVVQENFTAVLSAVSEDEWARLDVEDLVDLLSSDELNVPDERCVLDAALTWLNHHHDEESLEDERRQHAARVLAAVKLPQLSPQVSSHLPYSSYSRRSRGHPLSLPQLNTVLYKNMFVNRCLFQYI